MARMTKSQLSSSFVDGKLLSGSNFVDIFDSTLGLEQTGEQIASGSLKMLGNITAVKYIISSSVTNKEVMDVSGSTHFGDSMDDVHTRTGSMSITGSLTSSFFKGDGSALTNLPVSSTFPFTGDAVITGSLTISGSFDSFTLDTGNVVLGAGAGNSMLATADDNVIIGTDAGQNLTSGDGNVCVGKGARLSATGGGNIVVGFGAGATAMGSYNIAQGYQSGFNINGSGTHNVFMGYQAGLSTTSGGYNIIIGDAVNASANIASNELRIGKGSVHPISASLVTGDVLFPSTASAAYFSGDGSQLTNLPASSTFPFTGDAVITGSLLVSGSQVFIMDNNNVVLGANAGGGGINSGTDNANVIIGPSAAGAGSMNDGSKNILIGSGSGHVLAAGDNCIAIGTEALHNNTANINHIAIGYRALYNHSTGNHNIGIGYNALYDSAGNSSTGNIAIGYGSGYLGIGTYNVAIGFKTLYLSNNATDYNVAIGYQSGYTCDGDDNIFIGNQAGEAATTGDNNIIIGNEVEKSSATAGNEIKIGDSSIVPFSASLVTGDVLFPSTASAAYFSGDGSQLTNLPAASPFPLSGSAIISSSFTPGDTNSHVLQLIGSGSVSGSGLFEIQGSSTTLFSVTDDMTGELFAANDASGLSIISANADRTVKLGKPGGFGIVISGSDPMPTDAAARIEITGSTYFSGSVADFTNVGTITGTFPSSGGSGPSATTVNSLAWFM